MLFLFIKPMVSLDRFRVFMKKISCRSELEPVWTHSCPSSSRREWDQSKLMFETGLMYTKTKICMRSELKLCRSDFVPVSWNQPLNSFLPSSVFNQPSSTCIFYATRVRNYRKMQFHCNQSVLRNTACGDVVKSKYLISELRLKLMIISCNRTAQINVTTLQRHNRTMTKVFWFNENFRYAIIWKHIKVLDK